MKKLLVMVIALAVVFGMSAGVMAELASDSIDFDITVEKIASVEIDEDSLTLNIDSLESAAQVFFNVTVKSNTNVKTVATMNVTEWGSLNAGRMWGNKDTDNDWIISPNLVDDDRPNTPNAGGYTELVNGWEVPSLSDNGNGIKISKLMFEANINENAKWYDYEAFEDPDAIEGELVFTVSAM